jgi:signal transduction histidine kinase
LLRILVFREGKKTAEMETGREEITVGRDSGCDLVLDDRIVSRKHARIEVVEGKVRIRDLGSSNGTYVNRNRIEEHTLEPGDEAAIGGSVLRFEGLPGEPQKGGEPRRPAETAILNAVDATSLGKGEDVRRGEIDREAIARRFSALYDLGRELCGRLETEEIAETFLDLLMDVFRRADRAVLFLEDPSTRRLRPVAARGDGGEGEEIRISRTVLSTVLEEKQAVICGDTARDERFKDSASLQDLRIKSIMCVPLMVSDRVLGMVEVDSGGGGLGSGEEDLRLLAGLAAEVSIAIENARLYGQVEQSRRLAAIGQTVSGVAHCVKNVLNGIDGGLFIARRGLEGEDRDKVSKGWEMLERNSSFLKTLVLDMLDYSKERKPEYQEVTLDEIFKEIMAFVEGRAAEGGIELALDIDQASGKIPLDPKRMMRALLNIVGNAVEATETGGRVSITAGTSSETSLSISISDTGKGIPEDMLETIFEPFVSTKGSKGTGLGLPVTRKIIEEHGGRIEVESVVGKGTTFRITLPSTQV